MNRFVNMLQLGLLQAGYTAEIWTPVSYFSRNATSTLTGFGKWLGYIDKWLLFPIIIRWRIYQQGLHNVTIRFHICDHSNAPYLAHLPKNKTGITCHDILAIRGAFGYADAYCPASRTGKIFQQWIWSHLRKANFLAAVSHQTFNHLAEFLGNRIKEKKHWNVIHVAFNDDFHPLPSGQAHHLIATAGVEPTKAFFLHVGSALPRKNRKMLLDMVAVLGDKWNGNICFAGQALDEDLMSCACNLGLQERIISVVKPDHTTLLALYSTCEAFIFPSFSEGFGWPLIEAQASGAPVIASNIEPMPEVGGNGAIYADPHQPQAFADAFLKLKNAPLREALIQQGFENCKRFGMTEMIDAYLDLHGLKRVDIE